MKGLPLDPPSRTSSSPSLFSLFLRAIIIASALHLSLSLSHAFYLGRTSILPGLSSNEVTASGFQILTHTSVAPAVTLLLSSLEYLTTHCATHSRPYALFVSGTMSLGWLVSFIDWTACRGAWCRPAPAPQTDFLAFAVCFAWWAGGLAITLAYAACGCAEVAAMLGWRGGWSEGREVEAETGLRWPSTSEEKEKVSRSAGVVPGTRGGRWEEPKALGCGADSAIAPVPLLVDIS